MARIAVGSYMVRYPLGGMMSWVLQYLVGFQRLGHEVYFVEKSGYPMSCFDPDAGVMTADCSYGTRVVDEVLSRFDLQDQWCYVDEAGVYHGLDRRTIEAVMDSADIFIDMGSFGDWLEEAAGAGMRVRLDGEPGFTQMKMENAIGSGEKLPEYDRYVTNGMNVGTGAGSVPSAGKDWIRTFHPVVCELFTPTVPPRDGPFTTVMNWRSHDPLVYEARTYGQKDVSFEGFFDLPTRCEGRFELAVAGPDVPKAKLDDRGWALRDAIEVTRSIDSFTSYIRDSLGEFSVCKHVFVATNNGWFSDRGGAYLASGRPVIQQETGFSKHLPCGEGLFAVSTVEEAVSAVEEIRADPERHSKRARDIAEGYLDASIVLGNLLHELGV